MEDNNNNNNIEVPQFFICPISLQIMKDPVTAITGITYDRDNIEHWLFSSKNTTCPVTKQPLPKDSDLTPNHTLRRLIQAWCTDNPTSGIDRIPTPKPPLNKAHLLKLLKGLHEHPADHSSQLTIIKHLELVAAESDRNRKLMAEAGVSTAALSFLANCFRNDRNDGVEEALSILRLVRIPPAEAKQILILVPKNDVVLDSLTWVLRSPSFENHIKTHAVLVLRSVAEHANPSDLARLKPEFFDTIVGILREYNNSNYKNNNGHYNNIITQQGLNAALKIMVDTCPWGRNRVTMVESGAVFELVELEFGSTERKTTELVLGILFQLCSCADGRAEFLRHKGSVFVVSKRIFKVSPAADDNAVMILSMICRFSGTKQVLQEMLEVGAVSRLCVLLQVECAPYLKQRAREILKLHSVDWKDSPCIGDSYYPR